VVDALTLAGVEGHAVQPHLISERANEGGHNRNGLACERLPVIDGVGVVSGRPTFLLEDVCDLSTPGREHPDHAKFSSYCWNNRVASAPNHGLDGAIW
jgi:hypothetical protein